MTKVVKTERRIEREGNAAVERSGLAGNSSAGVNGSTVENGSSVENINPVENSSSVESISPVENNSPVGNTVSLTANRKYKDTVFRMLFSDKYRLLELYNAVSGRHYVNPDELQIVTLENAVYMGMKNDMAFLLDTGIYLYEHQSTINPNMPLRDLFYISSEYNGFVDMKSLYTSTAQKLPAPNFVVFYNDEEAMEDRCEYRLSGAFEPKVDNPALELRVTVLNVNYGRNPVLMEQCRTLADYAQYVALVRKYKAELGSLEAAVRQAVDECIRNDVLADFLRKNRAEVEMTSIFEYNQEEEERKLRAAERQAGYDKGYDSGYESGAADGEVRSTVKAVIKLMQNMKLTMEQALDTLDITGDEREEVLERLNKKMNV